MQALSSTQSDRCVDLLVCLLQANKNHFLAHSQALRRGCATCGLVKRNTSKKKITLRLIPYALYLPSFSYLLEIVVDCVKIYGLGVRKAREVPPWYLEYSITEFSENGGLLDL